MALTINKGGAQGVTSVDVWYVPVAAQSDFVAVGAASAAFAGIGAAMVKGKFYVLTTSTDAWFAQGAAPTASKAAGSVFVAKGVQWLIDGAQGIKIALIQDAAGGNASLVEVTA